ncbi:hypothetical protein AX17_007003 [Amanita inopinata Kibby_2008]|nr:hypothetical protein AX17_007003 [Amanita inopinata Kibby_2008]
MTKSKGTKIAERKIINVPARQVMAYALQQLGLRFAFSGKVAEKMYSNSEPVKLEVTIYNNDDNDLEAQESLVQKIVGAADNQHLIVAGDSELWYTSDPEKRTPRTSSGNARKIVVKRGTGQLEARDIRFIDHLPYQSPLLLLLTALQTCNLESKSKLSRLKRLLEYVHSWHTTAGETLSSSVFSRFPGSLQNAKQMCRRYPMYASLWVRVGLKMDEITSTAHDEDLHVISSHSSLGLAVSPDLREEGGNFFVNGSPAFTADETDFGGVAVQGSQLEWPESGSDRLQLVLEAATKAVSMLHKLGVHCAIFGGMACYLYGSSRVPNDVDILALPQYADRNKLLEHTAEELKQSITDLDPEHFYLMGARDPTSTYKVLWYSSNYTPGVQFGSFSPPYRCKVDILLPGVLHLPDVPLRHIMTETDYQLPVVPYPLLLLQKLQGWSDHVNAKEDYKQQRQHNDVSDIWTLLGLPHVVALQYSRSWDDMSLFDQEFQAMSRERVKKLCSAYPEQTGHWRVLGFEA